MLKMLVAAVAALSMTVPADSADARLSRAEQAMVRTIDTERDRTVAMLARWIDQNSGTLNFAGVRSVGDMLRAELEPLGFEVEWIDMSAAGRAGHIVATHKGDGRGKRLLLIGHLDTVFEPHSPFQRWTRNGDWGEGPGSVDDKGGMAVMIAALRAMHRAGTLRHADIKVVLTGDEEDVGEPASVARAPLIEAGRWADIALDFEGLARLDGRDMATVARRSSNAWTVTVTARSGHSSGIFSSGAGSGAIYELARIIEGFRRDLPEASLTYNVGLIGGGESVSLNDQKIRLEATGKTNIIAGTAIARGDLRALSAGQIERTRDKMRSIVAASLPGTRSEISFDEGGYPPMAPTEGNRALLEWLNRVNRDLKLPPMGELDPSQRGAADISYVAGDVDGLAGLGAAGRNTHAPGEAVEIPTIFLQAKRAAILMSRLSRDQR